MEESGRNFSRHRSRRLLTRYLCALFLCLSGAFPVAALEVDLFVSSFEITAGNPLVIAFTVRDGTPASTSLAEPEIPSSFISSSSRKELVQLESTGLFSGTRGSATVITREWIPSESGSFSLGPFSLVSGNDSVTLPPVYITVTAPKPSDFSALRWFVPDGDVKTGVSLRIVLEGFFSGTQGGLSCEAPENAILSPVPEPETGGTAAAVSEPGWTVVAEYDWTPLEEGYQTLPAAILEYTTPSGSQRKLASQSRSIEVSPSSPVSGSVPVSRTLGKAFSPSPTSGAAVPAPLSAGLFSLDSIPVEVATFLPDLPWKEGNYAIILHALRHAEYTKAFPSRFRDLRLAAEADLSLGKTLAVPPAAWKFWCVAGFAALLFLSLLLRLAGPSSTLLRGLSSAGIFCAVLLAIFAVYVYTRDMLPAGVVTGGELLNVPESNSTVIETLAEGRTVHVRRRAGDWVFVVTDASLEGWLPASRILQYTIMESDK